LTRREDLALDGRSTLPHLDLDFFAGADRVRSRHECRESRFVRCQILLDIKP
jgi:hypothetical protein